MRAEGAVPGVAPRRGVAAERCGGALVVGCAQRGAGFVLCVGHGGRRYPTFRRCSLRSEVLNLPTAFIAYLHADGVKLPPGCTPAALRRGAAEFSTAPRS